MIRISGNTKSHNLRLFSFYKYKKSNFMQIKFKKFDRIIVRIFFFITAPLGSGKVN